MKFGVGFTIFKCIWELCVLELQNKKLFQARQLLVFWVFFILKLVKTSYIDNYDLFFFQIEKCIKNSPFPQNLSFSKK